jgi:hypothetical protein
MKWVCGMKWNNEVIILLHDGFTKGLLIELTYRVLKRKVKLCYIIIIHDICFTQLAINPTSSLSQFIIFWVQLVSNQGQYLLLLIGLKLNLNSLVHLKNNKRRNW